MIKNAKFSGYYFDMNLNIWGDFQICISEPLNGHNSKEQLHIFSFTRFQKQLLISFQMQPHVH